LEIPITKKGLAESLKKGALSSSSGTTKKKKKKKQKYKAQRKAQDAPGA
jgi:hypothetical protein